VREKYATARGTTRLRHGMTWWKFRRFIRSVVGAFDGATVVSAEEREQLRRSAAMPPSPSSPWQVASSRQSSRPHTG
jgi:hypothetical protein